MKTKYAKSQCCYAKIYRFGHRRRQCSYCKKTWSIRPRKRGRPIVHISSNILRQVFLEKYTLRHLLQRRSGLHPQTFRYRFRQVLRRFVNGPNPQQIPPGPLILLADGLWFYFHNEPWVLYLTALRSVSGKIAVFLDPVLLRGREGAYQWKQVLNTIPSESQSRIRVLVADNLQGMKRTAQQNGWILQLCHFHLISKLQIQRGRARRALKGGGVREEIYQNIRKSIATPDELHLNTLLARLTLLANTFCGTQRIQAAVREFLHSVRYYRSYRKYPELNIPTTTNTVESMCSIVRDLLRRNHCASSPKSLLRWATAQIRMRQTLTCNGNHYQQK